MKKLNFRKNLISFSVIGCAIILASSMLSCKTVPGEALTEVDPIDLLDSNSTFYIAAPKSVDPELVTKLLESNMEGASSSDVNQIASRINKVYAGLIKSKYTTEIQASIDSNVPVKFIPKVLTKKNGWIASSYNTNSAKNKYSIYTNESHEELKLSFPSDSITCFGRNMNEMIEAYDSIHSIPATESIGKRYNQINTELYDWLKNAEDEIRFFANKPQSYLTMLTGANLDLKLSEVKGSFKVDPDYSNQYILNMTFRFKNASYVRAGKTLLMLAFGLTSSECSTPTPNELYISNIQISKSQLYKLLIQ